MWIRSNKKGSNIQPSLIEKEITENGDYYASSDNADGYSKVTVDVSSSPSSSYNFTTHAAELPYVNGRITINMHDAEIVVRCEEVTA